MICCQVYHDFVGLVFEQALLFFVFCFSFDLTSTARSSKVSSASGDVSELDHSVNNLLVIHMMLHLSNRKSCQ